jgi:hypothetical protein
MVQKDRQTDTYDPEQLEAKYYTCLAFYKSSPGKNQSRNYAFATKYVDSIQAAKFYFNLRWSRWKTFLDIAMNLRVP